MECIWAVTVIKILVKNVGQFGFILFIVIGFQ